MTPAKMIKVTEKADSGQANEAHCMIMVQNTEGVTIVTTSGCTPVLL
jgi:hypothetical protein